MAIGNIIDASQEAYPRGILDPISGLPKKRVQSDAAAAAGDQREIGYVQWL